MQVTGIVRTSPADCQLSRFAAWFSGAKFRFARRPKTGQNEVVQLAVIRRDAEEAWHGTTNICDHFAPPQFAATPPALPGHRLPFHVADGGVWILPRRHDFAARRPDDRGAAVEIKLDDSQPWRRASHDNERHANCDGRQRFVPHLCAVQIRAKRQSRAGRPAVGGNRRAASGGHGGAADRRRRHTSQNRALG